MEYGQTPKYHINSTTAISQREPLCLSFPTMGMGTPAESSPSESHLNDLATRTILEDSSGFMYVMAHQQTIKSQTAVLMLAFDGQNGQNPRLWDTLRVREDYCFQKSTVKAKIQHYDLWRDKLTLSLRELRRERPFDADNLASRLRFVQTHPTSLSYTNAVTT